MQLRNIPGVPLIFFEQNMLLMDKPSKISIAASERRENLKEEGFKIGKMIFSGNKVIFGLKKATL